MENYYDRLGLSRNATFGEIKAAYKRLAFKYHPDRNHLDPSAEEIFKRINEAYHVLSDPDKKAQYDLILSYGEYQPKKVTYYQPQTFRQYRPVRESSKYVFDRNYFKYQAIAILIVLFISSVVISITRLNKYLEQREIELIRAENNQILAMAHSKYDMGDFYGAIEMIQNLEKKYPTEYEIYEERNDMVENLYQKARRQYVLQDYNNAIFNLLIVKEFQTPLRLETWDYLAKCFVATNDYKRAVEAFEYIYLRDQYNIDLVLRIAKIYHYNLQELENALKYYTKAKKMFKERQKHLYGAAFELLMDPHDTPDIYFDIFYNRAKANVRAGNYKIAITDCNWATFLRPNIGEAYYIRATCYDLLGEYKKACKDYKISQAKNYSPTVRLTSCNKI